MRSTLTLILMVLLAACATPPRPRVAERSSNQAAIEVTRVPEYAVARGDTLYSIAFRLGVDYRELARWNRIHPPYTIYPGQRLSVLAPADQLASADQPALANASATTAPLPTRKAPTPVSSAPIKPSAGVIASSASSSPSTKPGKPQSRPQPSKPPASHSAAASDNNAGIHWRWPVDGRLLSRFATGDPTRQGIDIVGNSGDPVHAAAAGEVVYSGSGLVGYGELIIIKHNDTWLSAYGHNRKRLVQEGATVKAGQVIAELGRSGASREQLHFEIRRNGKPVDPLGLLPKR